MASRSIPASERSPKISSTDIGLRGRKTDVPEHFLNRPQVGAMHQHVGSEAVPEDVRGDTGLDAGLGGAGLDDKLSTSGGQPLAIAEVEKYRLAGAAARRRLAPPIQRVDGGFSHWNQPGLVALAVADRQHAGFPIDIAPVQCHRLADPQAR